jgi:Flp pilus assembly protein TadG
MTLIRDRRGVAMTEAVVVLPFFIIIWMSLVALHHVHQGRLEAQVGSMDAALSRSYRGCTGSDAQNLDSSGKSQAMPAQSADWLERISGEQPFGWSHTHGKCAVEVDGVPALYGGPERTVRASQTLLCNMKPKDGLVEMVFDLVKTALGIE